MEQHYSQHNMPDFPLIGLIWHRNGQQPAEQWHTDHTNRERPPAATILYGVRDPLRRRRHERREHARGVRAAARGRAQAARVA